MKRNLFLITAFMLIYFAGNSQKTEMKGAMMKVVWGSESHAIRCSDFKVTKPLREIAAEHPVTENKSYPFTEYPDNEDKPVQEFIFTAEKDGPAYGNDPSLIQRNFGKTKAGKALLQNWAGQTASGFRPFDPSGAAGINYYIQMINATTYAIYDKTNGNIVLSGNLGDLWDPPTDNSGDPIVLYDKAAGRWFLAQFHTGGNNEIYIAVSKTDDPTGEWYTYTFTSPDFPDYLKFSVWQDGYYMTANYDQKIFAFNRDKMLAGDGTAEAVYQTFNPPQPNGFFVPLPADASDGVLPDAGTPCTIFTYSDDGWGGGNIDAVNIYNASVDWNNLTMTVTNVGALSTQSFDSSYDSGWDDIPQPGTSQMLDGIGGALMYRAQWKKWSGYNTVLLTWAVKISSSQRGIFWCELRQDQTDDSWSIYQQGIYAPGTDYYWMSSAAMNDMGDIALCYAKGNGTDTYMSLAYTGRKAGDALGTMTLAETIVQPGESAQTGTNRNGDYSQTCVDPDGVTFWHTGEYLKSGGNAGTRVYSFQISDPVNPNITAQGVSTTQIDLSWTLNSDGDPALIAWSADGTFGTPADGTTYNPGDAIPGGGVVLVYGTTPTSYSHTGLNPATTYYYRAWSYQSNSTYTDGITTQGATLNGDPANLSASGVSVSQIDLDWDLNAEGDNVLLAWSADGTFGTPADGTTYNPGDAIPGGGTVLTYGNGTSYSHTGLNASTQYFYRAWSNLNGTSYSPGVDANTYTLCGIVTSFPFTEDFEGGTLPNCWSYEGTEWTYENGGHNGNPASAHSGSYNALFYNGSWTADVSKLITPAMDLSNLSDATLTFWHTQANWSGDQDELRIYYKTSSSGTWNLLETYTNDISSWTEETIDLPDLSSTYFIAFEATGQYGYGVAIDDITVDGTPACTAPSLQASAFSQTVQNMNDITVTWTRGNGDAVIVLAHEESMVDVNPGSGTTYSADAAFGSGDEIGTGNFVVYNGTGNSVSITGLNASTEYHFAVYEYFNTDVCYLKPALTGIASTCYIPVINSQPVDTEVCEGGDATFSVTAEGTNATYQWQKDGSDIAGATSASYTVTGVTSSDLGSYACVVSADCGSPVTSNSATLSFYEAPVITDQPADVNATAGDNVSFSITVTGSGLTYQWQKDGNDLSDGGSVSGSTGPVLTINPVAESDAGSYNVTVSNACSDEVVSDAAVLSVASSITDIDKYGINIYPNPNNGMFNIMFSNDFSKASLKITDISGKIIFEKSNLNKGLNTFDITNISGGIYFIHINYDNNPIISKIIINK
ncbi:MAG: T9SS type A sorting domain-containing protein [Chlorobi bacterium]|nr:T9SS type A sorting domain-containing protein [Chlorobiota bacterium]